MAQFLTIYNPSLDESEEGVAKQIVFYGSRVKSSQDEILRNVGLIQGVVELSRGFSNNKPLRYIDASNTRIVASLLESEMSWWIAAGVSLDCSEDDAISPPEVLVSDLKSAYYRWRLHYGCIEDLFNCMERSEFESNLQSWWNAFFNNWNTRINGSGIKNIFISETVTAKGDLENPTIDAIQAVIGREPGIRDMLIVLHGADKIEYDGCIWNGTGNLSGGSITDIVNWVRECSDCEENETNAFLEPSGYVRHLLRPQESSISTNEYLGNQSETIFKGALNSISNVSHNAYDQVVQLGSRLSLRSFSGTPIEEPRSDLEDSAPSNDLTESKYLIGLDEGLEEEMEMEMEGHMPTGDESRSIGDNTRSEEDETRLIERETQSIREEVKSTSDGDQWTSDGNQSTTEGHQSIPETRSDNNRPIITKKQLYLSMAQNPTSYNRYNVVIYQRLPFIFVGIYEPDEPSLNEKQYYQALHLRLASLSEPIFNDLNKSASFHSEKTRDFYYLAIDPIKNTIKSSLPQIPINLMIDNIDGEPQKQYTDLEKSASDRQQIIHVHLAIGSLLTNTFDYEQEKSLRSSRNWWIYWSKLKDGRLIVFTRKWSNYQKSQINTNNMLGALGQEGKTWLEEYKEHGRV